MSTLETPSPQPPKSSARAVLTGVLLAVLVVSAILVVLAVLAVLAVLVALAVRCW